MKTKEPIIDKEVLAEREYSYCRKASEILKKHGVHNDLGVAQTKVADLRRGGMNIRKALYVLHLADEIQMR